MPKDISEGEEALSEEGVGEEEDLYDLEDSFMYDGDEDDENEDTVDDADSEERGDGVDNDNEDLNSDFENVEETLLSGDDSEEEVDDKEEGRESERDEDDSEGSILSDGEYDENNYVDDDVVEKDNSHYSEVDNTEDTSPSFENPNSDEAGIIADGDEEKDTEFASNDANSSQERIAGDEGDGDDVNKSDDLIEDEEAESIVDSYEDEYDVYDAENIESVGDRDTNDDDNFIGNDNEEEGAFEGFGDEYDASEYTEEIVVDVDGDDDEVVESMNEKTVVDDDNGDFVKESDDDMEEGSRESIVVEDESVEDVETNVGVKGESDLLDDAKGSTSYDEYEDYVSESAVQYDEYEYDVEESMVDDDADGVDDGDMAHGSAGEEDNGYDSVEIHSEDSIHVEGDEDSDSAVEESDNKAAMNIENEYDEGYDIDDESRSGIEVYEEGGVGTEGDASGGYNFAAQDIQNYESFGAFGVAGEDHKDDESEGEIYDEIFVDGCEVKEDAVDDADDEDADILDTKVDILEGENVSEVQQDDSDGWGYEKSESNSPDESDGQDIYSESRVSWELEEEVPHDATGDVQSGLDDFTGAATSVYDHRDAALAAVSDVARDLHRRVEEALGAMPLISFGSELTGISIRAISVFRESRGERDQQR
jgi:midasin